MGGDASTPGRGKPSGPSDSNAGFAEGTFQALSDSVSKPFVFCIYGERDVRLIHFRCVCQATQGRIFAAMQWDIRVNRSKTIVPAVRNGAEVMKVERGSKSR